MNPPAALYGAMNRERKPFTYTPGGLDLSEIKSERMAKRLMRNAMNQGVPDTPVQPIKSPPASSIPVAIPNFNCLPVQVFPTFQLPANPKSLLRTRSNPDGSNDLTNKSNSQFVVNNKSRASSNTNKPCQIPMDKSYNNKELLSNISHTEQKNNNCVLSNENNFNDNANVLNPSTAFDAENSFNVSQKEIQSSNIKGDNYYSLPRIQDELEDKPPLNPNMQNNNKSFLFNNHNNGMNDTTLPQSSSDCYNDSFILPEISYEAEYLCTLPEKMEGLNDIIIKNTEKTEKYPSVETTKSQLTELDLDMESKDCLKDIQSTSKDMNLFVTDNYDNSNTPLSPEIYYEAESVSLENEPNSSTRPNSTICSTEPNFEILQDIKKNETHKNIDDDTTTINNFKDDQTSEHEQKEVKTVKKQSEKNINDSEVQNLNGDTEAEIVVKLPSKKSEAKTETQVEVEKKVLPDGTVEEITKTTTKTTINGKTETKITTATKTIPKEEVTEEEYEEEEETEENSEEVVTKNKNSENVEDKTEQKSDAETKKSEIITDDTEKEKLQNENITTNEEKSETSTTKKVVVIQSESQDSEEEEVEEEEEIVEEESEVEPDVEEVVVIKSKSVQESENLENKEDEVVNKEENVDKTEIEEDVEVKETENTEQTKNIDAENEEDEEYEEEDNEIEEPESETKNDQEIMKSKEVIKEEKKEENDNETKQEKPVNEDEEETEETFEEAVDKETNIEESKSQERNDQDENAQSKDDKQEVIVEKIIPIQQEPKKEEINKPPSTEEIKQIPQSSLKDVLREPSVPLEKVEEVEIKPIGPTQEIIKKSHTEIITTKTDKPAGLSTQTEYNVIENYVTVNRTTKTLDHAYEQTIAESSIPIIRSYIPPYETSVQPPSKPYQPIYPTQPDTEKRHSLLLDRISVERQIPIDTYQNNLYNSNQNYQETQYMFEPQSEVLTESNVKPSTITKNQQWYQQTKKDNYINNNASTPTYDWIPSQQQSVGSQNQQPIYQPQHAPEPQYKNPYIENTVRDSYKTVIDKQNVSSYTSKPTWVNNTYDPKPTIPSQPIQYSTNQSTESYLKSTQQYNSSYVPPPWEQDTGYVVENKNQNVYQPPPLSTFTPKPSQPWQPSSEPSKFTKPKPTSYIPPAPNQSFVKPAVAVDQPKLPGLKTYYSEYERRYISVPESTYIPTETKYQPQPDASPAYYYDNNEPAETVEPQWRKELREFTEKTQTITQTNETSVKPPWEEDPKYGNNPSVQSTPTWSQTLRPQTWRERSYEPEYTGAKEWPKTNTLGRGRPQSSYIKNNLNRIPERPRGVSVDRYNPNSYEPPIIGEHPPVQSQTLDHNIHPKPHYNPNVPGYHARASAEPREQSTYPQQRLWGDARATPIQSRSFKYLQWITGTED